MLHGTDIIEDVRSTLVEPVPGFWTDTEILSWLNRAENDFVNRTRMLEGKSFTSTISGVLQYPLPNNVHSVKAVLYNDLRSSPPETDNWVRLSPSNLEKTLQQNPNFHSVTTDRFGAPRGYFIWNRSLYLTPIPDLSGDANIMLFFQAKPIPLTSSASPINLDDSMREGLDAYILMKAFEKDNEPEKMALYAGIYDSYVRQGLRWIKRQSGDQRWKIDIASPTPFSGPYDNRFNPLA